jgi:integrase
MKKPPLTQRQIDTTKPPKDGRLDLRDSATPGLVLRISPTGSKSWSYEFRSPITGKMARYTLPAVTLAEARAQAMAHKMTVRSGSDPVLEAKEALELRREEHARAQSVDVVLDAYARDFVAGAKVLSRRERMNALRRAVAPFNKRAIASLTKADFITRLDEVELESGPIARNRAQAEIRAWLQWLFDRSLVPGVALAGVKKKINEKSRERTRVLTDAELGAMLTATADGSAFSDLVRVLLLTGMRKGEVANLQPRDLDFVGRTIKVRCEVSKTNYERAIPMVEAIAPMLQARVKGLGHEGYIFGNGSGFASPLSGWGKCTDRLREAMPEGEPWTLHDIRRTVATRLHDAGVDTLAIEDLLGHLSGGRGGMAGVYNRSVTLAKQRVALEAWAERLTASLASGNVVAFKRS